MEQPLTDAVTWDGLMSWAARNKIPGRAVIRDRRGRACRAVAYEGTQVFFDMEHRVSAPVLWRDTWLAAVAAGFTSRTTLWLAPSADIYPVRGLSYDADRFELVLQERRA